MAVLIFDTDETPRARSLAALLAEVGEELFIFTPRSAFLVWRDGKFIRYHAASLTHFLHSHGDDINFLMARDLFSFSQFLRVIQDSNLLHVSYIDLTLLNLDEAVRLNSRLSIDLIAEREELVRHLEARRPGSRISFLPYVNMEPPLKPSRRSEISEISELNLDEEVPRILLFSHKAFEFKGDMLHRLNASGVVLIVEDRLAARLGLAPKDGICIAETEEGIRMWRSALKDSPELFSTLSEAAKREAWSRKQGARTIIRDLLHRSKGRRGLIQIPLE